MKPTLRWLLAISLVLNVLLVGIAIGRWSHGFGPMRMGPPPPPPAELSSLPPEKREALEESLRGLRENDRELFPMVEKKRRALMDVMEAEEFDEEAFRKQSRELGEMFVSSKRETMEKTIRLAKTLSQEERKLLAQHLRRPPPPPPPGGPGGPPPGPPL